MLRTHPIQPWLIYIDLCRPWVHQIGTCESALVPVVVERTKAIRRLMWSTCFACIFVLPRVPCVNSLFAITVAKTVIAVGCQRSAPFTNDTRSPPPGECLLCVPQSHGRFFVIWLLDLSVLILELIVRKISFLLPHQILNVV